MLLLPFQVPRARSLWFGPAVSDDFQIRRHHQGFRIFNPDISDASQVLVDRRPGQGATIGAGFLSQLVACHPVIVERLQDGLAQRAELPSGQIAGRIAANRSFCPFQFGYVVRLNRASHRFSEPSQVSRRARLALAGRHADHLTCLRLLGHSVSFRGGLRAVR